MAASKRHAGIELLRIGLFKLCGVNSLLAWIDKKLAKFSI